MGYLFIIYTLFPIQSNKYIWGSNSDISGVCVCVRVCALPAYPYKGKGLQEVSPGCRI